MRKQLEVAEVGAEAANNATFPALRKCAEALEHMQLNGIEQLIQNAHRLDDISTVHMLAVLTLLEGKAPYHFHMKENMHSGKKKFIFVKDGQNKSQALLREYFLDRLEQFTADEAVNISNDTIDDMKPFFSLTFSPPNNKIKVMTESEAAHSSQALVGVNRWIFGMVELQRAVRPYKNVLRQLQDTRKQLDEQENCLEEAKDMVKYLERYKAYLEGEKSMVYNQNSSAQNVEIKGVL